MKFWEKVKASNPLPLIAAVGVYLTAIFIINPIGEFAINDDWDFYLHVREFLQGNFTKNSLIDSVFVLQGLLASAWARVYGLSFSSLRILTIIVTLAALLGINKIFSLYAVSQKLRFLGFLSFLFNPFVFLSSLSFMTENYFLCAAIWSTYFFFKYLNDRKILSLLFCSLLCFCALLIRQFGLVLSIAYLLILVSILFGERKKRISGSLKAIALVIGFTLVALFIERIWPQYQGSHALRMSNLFLGLKDYLEVWQNITFSLPYFGMFLFLFVPIILRRLRIISVLVILLFALPLAAWVYSVDLFPIGNVFHIEGILVRDEITIDSGLFNTILLKLVISYLISISVITLIYQVITSGRKILQNDAQIFLFLATMGFFGSVVISSEFFDRYLINVSVFLVIGMVILVQRDSDFRTGALEIVLALLYAFLTFSLTYDYFVTTRIKWQQAEFISKKTGISGEFYISTSYSNYQYTKKYEDFSQIKSKNLGSQNFNCFSQIYTREKDKNAIKKLALVDMKLNVMNPDIYDRYQKPYIKIEDSLSHLLINKEYYSPIRYLAGYRSFVGTYCTNAYMKAKGL